jgi:hypothetical protein
MPLATAQFACVRRVPRGAPFELSQTLSLHAPPGPLIAGQRERAAGRPKGVSWSLEVPVRRLAIATSSTGAGVMRSYVAVDTRRR